MRAITSSVTLWIILFVTSACFAQGDSQPIRVGSKLFTESVILGEIIAQSAQTLGYEDEHTARLGSTQVCFEALRTGAIDAYSDYTGTIARELLGDPTLTTPDAIRAALADLGIGMTDPLGFNNTYALGMTRERAERLGVTTISDLRDHPSLIFGFQPEFINRADGWPALREIYGLPQREPVRLDHNLAYAALNAGEIDAKELFSTDAKIVQNNLVALVDDRSLFPRYEAVILYRLGLKRTHPDLIERWKSLAGRIDEATILEMNASADLEGQAEALIAQSFVQRTFGTATVVDRPALFARIMRTTRDHLVLVGISLAMGLTLALPLGLLAARRPKVGQIVLAVTGLFQTIPSIALLMIFVPLLGIGAKPAIGALFLYSLLPIVRNTHAGFTGIPKSLRESADALGLPPKDRLLRVELPLAAPTILAGIKIAVVINIGAATLGAFVGSGGYGEPIYEGLQRGLNTGGLPIVLEGAIPAALMAIVAQITFEGLERALVPAGIRPKH